MPQLRTENETVESVDFVIADVPKSEIVDRDGVRQFGKAAWIPVLRWMIRRALGAPDNEVAVNRLKLIFTDAEMTWLKNRIEEALL